jgi:hypothetical protein
MRVSVLVALTSLAAFAAKAKLAFIGFHSGG